VIADRLQREASRSDGELLQTILYQLLGLKYDETGMSFWSGLMNVADFRHNYFGKLLVSVGRRETILEQGTDKFGPPPGAVSAAIAALEDEAELRRLGKRLLHVQSWDELLAG
jgi:hypothetical protein